MALLAAMDFGVWQYSHQAIFGKDIQDVVWFFWAAFGFLSLQFVTRFIVEYREERTNTRRINTMRRIGDLIGEGNVLVQKINAVPFGNQAQLDAVTREMTDWEDRTERFVDGYDAHYTPYLRSRLAWNPIPGGAWSPLPELINRVGARIQKLEELFRTVAIR